MNKQAVLITGAGTGIGAACAELFSQNGFDVVLVGRRENILREAAKKVKTKSWIFSCDLADKISVHQLVKRVLSDVPHLTCLINNAGIFEMASIAKGDVNHWKKTFDTNLFGAAQLTQELWAHLEKQNGSSIVNVSSTLGLKTVPGTAAYSASKAAMISWTHTLALEGAKTQIRANCVCPGVVDTPIHEAGKAQAMAEMHPLGRVGTPEELAYSIYFFCTPHATWITGAVLTVDGGINL